MITPSISAIAGQVAEPTLTGSNAIMTPKAFAEDCAYIVRTETGDQAHRQLDQLVTLLLCSLGYGDGMAVFVAHVGPYHDRSIP